METVQFRVISSGGVNIRNKADKNATVVARIGRGNVLTVVAPSVIKEGYTWWQFASDSNKWVAEITPYDTLLARETTTNTTTNTPASTPNTTSNTTTNSATSNSSSTATPTKNTLLAVPYVTQLDNSIGLDCGPASILSILKYEKRIAQETKVATFIKEYASQYMGRNTTYDQLQNIAKPFFALSLMSGIPSTETATLLRTRINNNEPSILLVWYANLGWSNPATRSHGQGFGHWFVLVGYEGDDFFINDPLWTNEQSGKARRISSTNLITAIRKANYHNWGLYHAQK